MSHIKFHHVFASLLILSALSAFVLGQKLTDRSRAAAQGIFAPIARPTHAIAGWVHEKFGDGPVDDDGPGGKARTSAEIIEENRELRATLANFSAQLEDLKNLDAQMKTIANVRELCTLVKVSGGDAGSRQSISLATTSMNGIQNGQPVLAFGQNIVGRIDRVSVSGAQVKLITDADSTVTGSFGRVVRDDRGMPKFDRLDTPATLARGNGKSAMLVPGLSMEDVKLADLRVGDWMVLDDPEWPRPLQGYILGKISSISPTARSPLHAEIVVQPRGDLMSLREVMVMVKG
jgi:hypothetical protein